MIEKIAEASQRHVSRETFDRLSRYVSLLLAATSEQNLIARSTIDAVWERHIIDSAQLLRYVPPQASAVDLGSGAGLPGVVLAILNPAPITLVEPRRLRAEFLQHCVDELNLQNATIVQAKAERVTGQFGVITARAVTTIDHLFLAARHLSHSKTVWVLPKGRNGQMELAAAEVTWQGRFETRPSITEGDAVIVVASNVAAKRKGRG